MKRLLAATLFMSTLLLSNQDENDAERLRNVAAQLEEIFAKTPPAKIIDLLIQQEKRKLIEVLLSRSSNPIKSSREAYSLPPKYPTPLSEEEKNKNVHERIKEKYIGQIPDFIRGLAYYFEDYEENSLSNVPLKNNILLYGKPGRGKKYLINLLAQELQLPLFQLSAATLNDDDFAASSRKLRNLFEDAINLNQPTIIFIDKLDAIATKRKNSNLAEHNAILSNLLIELEKIQKNKSIAIIVASDNLDSLAPSVVNRFGCFTREIKALSLAEKTQLCMTYLQKHKLPADEKLALYLAKITYQNFSNTDTENIILNARSRQMMDCQNNPQNCNKLFREYLKTVVDRINKQN